MRNDPGMVDVNDMFADGLENMGEGIPGEGIPQ